MNDANALALGALATSEAAGDSVQDLLVVKVGTGVGAGIVSVKVGDNTGYTDVSQVIAGVDWVTDNAAAAAIA